MSMVTQEGPGGMSKTEEKTGAERQTPVWIRLWPVYVIAAGIITAWQTGLFSYLSIDTLRDQQETLQAFVSSNPILAVGLFIVIYAAATLFMIPGALWITIAGGFLFGLVGGTLATVTGASLGASCLFFAAKTSLGKTLRDIAGKYADKVESEFTKSPLSYMFAMRFIPAMPFPVANIVPALLNARYRDYLLTTAIGIIPGVLAYTSVGSGLGATFARGEDPDLQSVVVNLLPAIILLLIVSLLPIAYKKFAARKAARLKEAA